ncbi:MAG: hypothetical protein ACAH83_09210 [Alphaproteobacteria bacterium]
MDIFKKLKDIFRNPQADAERRVDALIAQQCDWFAIESLVFPDKGVGPRMSAVLHSIIEAKNFKLLTPLVARAGDWMDLIDLVYRPGKFGAVPPTRVQDLEDIYTALSAAKGHGAKAAKAFVNCVETWACQRNSEACYDWAVSKPEAGPLQALGLAALADHKIDGNPLAMKIIKTPADIDRAIEAVDWIYSGNASDRYTALDNLEDWRKKLEENSKKPPSPPAPGGPKP